VSGSWDKIEPIDEADWTLRRLVFGTAGSAFSVACWEMRDDRGTLLLEDVPAIAEKTVAGAWASSATGAVVVVATGASVAKGEALGAGGVALIGAAASPPKIPAMLDLPPGGACRRVEDRSVVVFREINMTMK